MKAFMDRDFLLHTETARELFHGYAECCPIIDYHNHLSPRDIAQARQFHNLTELWLETDHYKWRAMRACGVEEAYITGKDTDDYQKFQAWAKVVPRLAGSPLYHWTHLELQRYFGISAPLMPETAAKIWEQTCEMLKRPDFNVPSLLEKQKVKVLCTTDDPADRLEWHTAIAADPGISFRVLPSFRPDRYLAVESEVFRDAVRELEERNDVSIKSIEDLKQALKKSLDRFAQAGCRLSDHSLSVFSYGRGNGAAAFQKAMAGEAPTEKEIADYRGDLLRFLGGEYQRRKISMQLHFGALRNVSTRLFQEIGADAGGDSVGTTVGAASLGAFLDDLDAAENLPHTVLYNLNPADNMVLSTMAADFAPTVKYGAAWWFNDTMRGIRNQLQELMETGQLAESIGMLTDSRSFTSFPRHEYYRRILCDTLGQLVEDGLYPDDATRLGQLVEDVCWRNAARFLRLE
ncbi:MAG: glucuronate isomerase [Clostridiales bacterium]|nr:glucuronate isomerase [Clostridiales bacterium]